MKTRHAADLSLVSVCPVADNKPDGHCHIEQVEAVFDRGEARLRHWNRVGGLSPGRQ